MHSGNEDSIVEDGINARAFDAEQRELELQEIHQTENTDPSNNVEISWSSALFALSIFLLACRRSNDMCMKSSEQRRTRLLSQKI